MPAQITWQVVGFESQVQDGQIVQLSWEGVPIAAARLNGKIRAVDDRCPHFEGAMLSGGFLKDGAIGCSACGALFDLVTGRATWGPTVQDLHTFKTGNDGYGNLFVGDDIVYAYGGAAVRVNWDGTPIEPANDAASSLLFGTSPAGVALSFGLSSDEWVQVVAFLREAPDEAAVFLRRTYPDIMRLSDEVCSYYHRAALEYRKLEAILEPLSDRAPNDEDRSVFRTTIDSLRGDIGSCLATAARVKAGLEPLLGKAPGLKAFQHMKGNWEAIDRDLALGKERIEKEMDLGQPFVSELNAEVAARALFYVAAEIERCAKDLYNIPR